MRSTPATIDGGWFRSVDAGAAAGLVAALDEQAALPAFQRLRAAAIELLSPQGGQWLVDVGCGTGEVARSLAVAVGESGHVVGIDPSATMLAEARRRTVDQTLSVEFRRGRAGDIDVDDATFDGSYCERVLQHLEDPASAVTELVRITRPGGRVVVVDTDWGMHAVHGADPHLTKAVLDAWAAHLPNGWSARRIPALLVDAGMAEPVVRAETFTSTDRRRPTQPPFTTMAEVAEALGAVTAGDARRWLAQLAEAAARGRFLWAVTMFVVAGRKATWAGESMP